MKLTKKLETILERYDISLRQGHTRVTHMLTGETTECDPMTFSVFEAAIKSLYLSNALHPQWGELCEAGHHRHYQAIASRNNFELPDASAVQDIDKEAIGRRAADDYHYCVVQISKAGLYYALLD